MQSAIGVDGWKWGKTRRLVMIRDGHRCQLRIERICKGTATEVDHIVPRLVGGDDSLDNLRAVCHPCHVARGLEGTSVEWPRRNSYGPSRVIVRDYTRREG